MNLEEIFYQNTTSNSLFVKKDLKEEICFYDKVVLNKMLEVDIKQEFQKNGILIISNINFEKFFLKNSIDIITGLASDKIYSNVLKIINSIIKEENYRENIFVKGKKEGDFLLIFSKNENPNHDVVRSINKTLEDNNIYVGINNQKIFQKNIPYKILK